MQDIKLKNNRNQTLNFLKGIACICVVFIHVHFPNLLGAIISKLSQFAVPVFYMIAGYYALNCSTDTIKRRLLKIFKIFIYAIILFFSFYLIIHIIDNNYQEWLLNIFTLNKILRSIVFCEISYAIPLWYLIAMIETYIFWFFVVKYKKEKILLKFMPVFFILGFILTSYVETKGLAWCLKMNFITRALSWFLLGYYIHLHQNDVINKLKNNILLSFIILGCIVALIPIILKTNINFSCIGLFFYSAALFILAIKYENTTITNVITYIGDKLSLNIYILHVLIAKLLHYINLLLLHIQSIVLLSVKPLIVVFLTILTAYIIEILKNKLISSKVLKTHNDNM